MAAAVEAARGGLATAASDRQELIEATGIPDKARTRALALPMFWAAITHQGW